jgi:cation diffusion facilitator family transporter
VTIKEPIDADTQRYHVIRKVTLIGAASNVVLAIAQFAFGVFGHSQALIADGIHSLSDLVTDILGVFGAKHASRAADEDHPYGHGRIEAVVTVALGMVLTAAAAFIMFDATHRLFEPQRLLQPDWTVLAVAAVSVAVKEMMYRYTLRVARAIRSGLLQTNAWHHRSDALSSIIVIVGVGGTMSGLNYLDAIAAIGVAVMIARVGLTQAWAAVQELIDQGLDAEHVANIRSKILAESGVRELHLLRTRRVGGNAFVDVHIQVDPRLSVSEAHQISEAVRVRLIDEIDEVSDVTIHIDPEDDLIAKPSTGLPPRDAVLTTLKQHWSAIPQTAQLQDTTLHYLDGKIHVDLALPLSAAGSVENAHALAQQFAQLAKKEEYIADVKVGFVV